MKFKIFKFKNVTSTNDIALDLIKKKKMEIGCVCAETQTHGRGTYGKSWISNKGNFFGSLFFPLKSNYPPFREFSIINSVIMSDIIKLFCKKKVISLKKPNDVFVNKKKVCGILQEIIISNNKKFLIIGVGVNIISNPNVNKKYQTTNIFLETNKKPSINSIIKLFVKSYENFFFNLDDYKYLTFKKRADLITLN